MFKFLPALFICFLLSTIPCHAYADNMVNIKEWSQLPVLHEGRLKPIDSFARVHYKTFSQKQIVSGKTANSWLAEVLFSPDEAAMTPIFKIRNYEDFDLPKRNDRLYSYVEIAPRLQKRQDLIDALLRRAPQDWSTQQQEIMTLYQNVSTYVQLLRSVTAILPLNINDDGHKTYIDLKGSPKIQSLSMAFRVIEQGGRNNNLLRVIPNDWDHLDKDWQSIWQAVNNGQPSTKTQDYITLWKNFAHSYRDSNSAVWERTLQEIPEELITTRIKTEYLYNILNLLMLAAIFYFLTFCIIIISHICQKKHYERFALILLTLGALANGLDLIGRIYILNRPPVGTLYESIIFVSFICVLGCIFMAQKYKNQMGLLLGSISGTLLILTAKGFAGDDTMNTLVAVLNTNFWLLTHVLCITIGYAVCLLTSLTAHYYLCLKIRTSNNKDHLKQIARATKTLVILALLFTSIGTILGGIWADQSWGRFWGWDPKENGALLIVLWLVWLIHGKISNHLNETGFIIGSAFLSIIVVLAWFGVNLLSVGLHSYGFISGIAMSIGGFCAIEMLLITALWLLGRKKVQP